MRILIADDSPISRRLLEATLSRRGYQVVATTNGAEALAALQQPDSPLLAILDVDMPEMDGIEACRKVRQIPQPVPTYIILLTARSSKADVVHGLEAGADDYVIKPFDPDELQARVKVGLRIIELQQRLAEKLRELEDTFADLQRNSAALTQVNEELIKEVTERRQAEEALRASEERYRHLFENSPEGIYRMAPDGRLMMANPTLVRMLGYDSLEQLVASNVRRAGLEDAETGQRFQQLAEQNGEVKGLESIWKKRDQTIINIRESAKVIRAEDGGVLHYEGTVEDITDRKRTEEELRKAHEETEQLLTAIQSILIAVDASGKITRWNQAAARTFGLDETQVIGRSLLDCQIGWDFPGVLDHIKDALGDDPAIYRCDVRFKDLAGKDGLLGLTLYPFKGQTNANSGCLMIAADITERKILENQLRQAQKLESIGQLAAGIAHEINTPMQYVGDNTRFLQDAFRDLNSVLDKYSQLLGACQAGSPEPQLVGEVEQTAEEADVDYLAEEIPKALKQSLEGIGRVTKIVQSMKDFAHPGTVEKKAVDLNKAIESTVTVAMNEWKYIAEMETDFDPSLPLVPCLLGEFNQVILNLIINATHAIADVVGQGENGKGRIALSTRRHGEWVEVRVADSGTGIPEAVRSRIFDPFFTTKEVGRGTGQGLAIAHTVVAEKHGGSISFETETGQGTTFIIRLPLH